MLLEVPPGPETETVAGTCVKLSLCKFASSPLSDQCSRTNISSPRPAKLSAAAEAGWSGDGEHLLVHDPCALLLIRWPHVCNKELRTDCQSPLECLGIGRCPVIDQSPGPVLIRSPRTQGLGWFGSRDAGTPGRGCSRHAVHTPHHWAGFHREVHMCPGPGHTVYPGLWYIRVPVPGSKVYPRLG